MKKLLAFSVFTIVIFVFPAIARAQYTTYTPPWNPPGPDVTQAIIEKNMMRDRLRKIAKKGNKAVYAPARKTAAKKAGARKPVVRKPRSRRAS